MCLEWCKPASRSKQSKAPSCWSTCTLPLARSKMRRQTSKDQKTLATMQEAAKKFLGKKQKGPCSRRLLLRVSTQSPRPKSPNTAKKAAQKKVQSPSPERGVLSGKIQQTFLADSRGEGYSPTWRFGVSRRSWTLRTLDLSQVLLSANSPPAGTQKNRKNRTILGLSSTLSCIFSWSGPRYSSSLTSYRKLET